MGSTPCLVTRKIWQFTFRSFRSLDLSISIWFCPSDSFCIRAYHEITHLSWQERNTDVFLEPAHQRSMQPVLPTQLSFPGIIYQYRRKHGEILGQQAACGHIRAGTLLGYGLEGRGSLDMRLASSPPLRPVIHRRVLLLIYLPAASWVGAICKHAPVCLNKSAETERGRGVGRRSRTPTSSGRVRARVGLPYQPVVVSKLSWA